MIVALPTPTGMYSRDNEVCICVIVLYNRETCFAELIESYVVQGKYP